MRFRFHGVVVALLAVVIPKPAHGSVVEALELAALARAADDVVVADVVSQTARWDSQRRIVTDVEMVVVTSMKGERRVGDPLVLTRLGGAIGGLGMRVEGEPTFDDGDRVLVFAREIDDARRAVRPVGMAQGVMRVERGLVWPSAGGLALVRRDVDGALRPAPPALTAPRPLADVVAEIRASLEVQP